MRGCDSCGHVVKRLRHPHPLALSTMPHLDRRLLLCPACDHKLEDDAKFLWRAS